MKYKLRYITNYSCGLGIITFINKDLLIEWLNSHIQEIEYIVIEEIKLI